MTISDGAKKLYRDSKLGLTAQTVITVAAAGLVDWLTTLPALASTAVGTAVGVVAGAITAWMAKRGTAEPGIRLTTD